MTLPRRESLTVEFKSDKKGYPDRDLVEAVVAMTNSDGGVLYLGIEDNGLVTGVIAKHEDEMGLAAMICNSTLPAVFVDTIIEEYDGLKVMKISIPKSTSIVASVQGKILRRRLKANGEPENVPFYPYEITTRLSDLSLLDFSYRIVEEATYEDLDQNEFIRLRNFIVKSSGETQLLELDNEEIAKALCLVREVDGILKPTVTGLLLVGESSKIAQFIPTSSIVFQVLEGSVVRKNEEFRLPLLKAIEEVEINFDAWNKEYELDEGMLRVGVNEFSKVAFREAFINALCHRDYTMLGAVRILIDDEGLIISNPGGFVEGVTIDNLLTVEPHGRNKILADTMKRIGLAEKTGRGIDRIYEGSVLFGKPWPDYSESTNKMVKLFIQRAKPDYNFYNMIANVQNDMQKLLNINMLLIMSVIYRERRVTFKRILEVTKIRENKIRINLEKLIEMGLIEAQGQGVSRSYILGAKVYKNMHDEVNYVRQSEIDEIRFDELIMKFVKVNGEISRQDVCDLLSVSKDQAYRLLKRLVEKEKLVKQGSTRSTVYVVRK